VASAVSIPETGTLDVLEAHSAAAPRSDILAPENALEKRKGGGGKGGGSSGGTSGGKSGTGSGGSGGGTGAPRSFGGGKTYGGGATTTYKSGGKTPNGLLAGALLLPAAALVLFPGLWLYSVYPYSLNPYRFYNESSRLNQSMPVTCLCQEYTPCGCDNSDDDTTVRELVGTGEYSKLNKSLITVSDVNGTQTLVINGSLPNGTDSGSAAPGLYVSRWSGYGVMAVIVISMVLL